MNCRLLGIALRNMSFIIIDLEATCWNPESVQYQQEIIEIGACWIDSYLDIKKTFSKIVKPALQPNLSLYCKQLTGIQQQEIDKSKPFGFVFDQFMEWCEDDNHGINVYTWGLKDLQLLNSDCRSHRISMDWLLNHVDLKSQFARIKGYSKPVGLMKALEVEGFEFEGNHHRALPDAINLAKLFVRYFDEWEKA